jgi:hypothetical protein
MMAKSLTNIRVVHTFPRLGLLTVVMPLTYSMSYNNGLITGIVSSPPWKVLSEVCSAWLES